MKESLILIPGVGSDDTLWEHQVRHVEDLVDVQVKVLYHEGGRAESVTHVLKEAPDRFALAGHSYGGWMAQAVAAEAPHRVSKLMLFNTWTRFNETHLAMLDEWLEKIEKKLLIPQLDDNVPFIIHPDRLRDQHFLKTLQRMQHEFSPNGYRLQFHAMIKDYGTTSLLPNISCPTLVVHAREDMVFSLEEHQYLAQHINGAKLTIIEECGHMAPMEQPQAVTALMRLWLSA